MQAWIVDLTERFGYLGILFLIFLENIFPPIPSEIILPFSGFLTTVTGLSLSGVVWYATAGSVLGAIVLYGAGCLLNERRLEQVVTGRVGRLLRFKMDQIEKAFLWFHKYGIWTALFCRCIPIVRSLISIPAGMTRMPFAKFLCMTILGSLAWNIALVSLGAFAGSSWVVVSYYISVYGDIVKIIAAGILLSLLMGCLLRARKVRRLGRRRNT